MGRNQSLSEDIKREIKKKKNSESMEVREIVNVEKPDTAIDNMGNSDELAEKNQDNKKKSKKKLKDLGSGIDAPEDTESTDQPAKKKSKKETKVHADNTERGTDVPENTDSTDQPTKKKSKKETKVRADNTEVTDHSVKKKSK